MTTDDCPHNAWTGDEGPVRFLGRWPRRWRCDGCGYVRIDPRVEPSVRQQSSCRHPEPHQTQETQ